MYHIIYEIVRTIYRRKLENVWKNLIGRSMMPYMVVYWGDASVAVKTYDSVLSRKTTRGH